MPAYIVALYFDGGVKYLGAHLNDARKTVQQVACETDDDPRVMVFVNTTEARVAAHEAVRSLNALDYRIEQA